ncbi:anaerobic C4-dicarboxylate transporter DcuC, partial [Klebsiella pneumoniae]
MMELLIGTLVTLTVGRYIFKGYSATGVLLSGGLLLLTITALMGKTVLPASVTS